jgi:hypothetical protein
MWPESAGSERERSVTHQAEFVIGSGIRWGNVSCLVLVLIAIPIIGHICWPI